MATSAAARPAATPATTWWSARWKGETPAGHQEGVPLDHRLLARGVPHPAHQRQGHAQRHQGAGGYKAQPLSAYLKQPAPPAAPARSTFPKFDKDLVKTEFFEYLDFALQFAPAGPEEEAIRAKLASIGIGPGKKFAFKDLSLEHKAAILLGMKEGDKKVEKYAGGRARRSTAGRSARRSVTALSTRATGCCAQPPRKAGIYGNDAVEAMYPMTKTLADGGCSTAASTSTR
jgi:hypothetical protein